MEYKKIKKSEEIRNRNESYKTSKTLFKRDSLNKRKKLSNKTFSNFPQIDYFPIRNLKRNIKEEIIDFKKEKPNLKIIENEIFAKIHKMKINYQKDSLVEKEIVLNNSLNRSKFEIINNNNNPNNNKILVFQRKKH